MSFGRCVAQFATPTIEVGEPLPVFSAYHDESSSATMWHGLHQGGGVLFRQPSLSGALWYSESWSMQRVCATTTPHTFKFEVDVVEFSVATI